MPLLGVTAHVVLEASRDQLTLDIGEHWLWTAGAVAAMGASRRAVGARLRIFEPEPEAAPQWRAAREWLALEFTAN